MKSLLTCLLAAASLLGLGSGAWAQTPTPTVTSTLAAQRVDTVDGKTVLKPATDVKPGDVIEYAGTYKNNGAAPIDKLMATVPVPVGTTLIASSVVPAKAQASTDGSTFAAMPLTRAVRQPDGSERRVAVPLADYRAVRWEIGSLAAAASSVVTLRVKVDSTPAPAAAASAPKS